MSLFRAPLVLIAMLSYQASLAVSKVANKADRERAVDVSVASVDRPVHATLIFNRLLVATVFTVEAAASYASSAPSSAYSDRIITFLGPAYAPSLPPKLSPLFLLAVLLVLLGTLIRVLCFRVMKHLFTYQIALSTHHKLVTSGPYAYVRHPSYTGAVLVQWGIPLCLGPGSWWWDAGVVQTGLGRAIAVFWACMMVYMVPIVRRGYKEDKLLQDAFGEEWEAYARRVPWLFVPGVL